MLLHDAVRLWFCYMMLYGTWYCCYIIQTLLQKPYAIPNPNPVHTLLGINLYICFYENPHANRIRVRVRVRLGLGLGLGLGLKFVSMRILMRIEKHCLNVYITELKTQNSQFHGTFTALFRLTSVRVYTSATWHVYITVPSYMCVWVNTSATWNAYITADS